MLKYSEFNFNPFCAGSWEAEESLDFYNFFLGFGIWKFTLFFSLLGVLGNQIEVTALIAL